MIPTPAVASADLLSTMAHELRQPLSAIESIAYYLTLILPAGDGKIHEQLNRIQQLVEQSNWIVTSAQQLSDSIQPAREAVDVGELIAQVVLERAAVAEVPAVEIEGELPLIPAIQADRTLVRALIENLLMLFRTVSSAHPPKLRLREQDGGVAIELTTEAPGHKSEASLGPGATLSLESARRIAAAHGGSFDLKLDPANGICLRVMLP